MGNVALKIKAENNGSELAYEIHRNGTLVAGGLTVGPPETAMLSGLVERHHAALRQGATVNSVDALRQLGEALFSVLLGSHWSQLDLKAPGSEEQFVVFSDIPWILNLPWELLRPPGEDFLGVDLHFGMRRVLWYPQDGRSLEKWTGTLRPRPLRILFAASAPVDQDQLDYEREEEAIRSAAGPTVGSIAFYSADFGTFDELRTLVNLLQPHIVHLSGHGVVENGAACFAFENPCGRTDLHTATQISRDVFAGSPVQCVFVSGCETAQAPEAEAIGGVCQALVREGVPLAIGWAARIADRTATEFARSFYGSLASGCTVDRALTTARRDIQSASRGRDLSWTLPVLYSCTDQPRIYDTDPERAVEVPPRPTVVVNALPGMKAGYTKHFVGRRREQQRLLPALRSGDLQVLILTGLGGAGKSTLATHLTRKLQSEGYHPLAVSAEVGRPVGSGSILQAVRSVCPNQEDRQRLDDPARDEAERLHDVVRILNEQRYILVIDNFEVNLEGENHYIADPLVAGFYRHLLDGLSGNSRVILTSRYLPNDLKELPSDVLEVPLGDFSLESFRKLLWRNEAVETRYYRRELSDNLLRELYRCIGGTPRFVEQIASELATADEEALHEELADVRLPEHADASALQAARDAYCESIVIASLYEHLGSDASREALSRCAAFRQAMPIEAMTEVSGVERATLQSHLADWQQKTFAYPMTSRVAGAALWAIPGVVRTWLLEQLGMEKRNEALAAAGEVLYRTIAEEQSASLGMPPWEADLEATILFLQAGKPERAWATDARLYNFMTRRGWYRQLEQAGRAFLAYGDYPQAMEHIARSLSDRGQYEAARIWYEKMRETAKEDPAVQSRALHGIASIDVEQGNYDAARTRFEASLVINRGIGDRSGEAATLHQLATIDLEQGNYDAARTRFEASLVISREIGYLYGVGASCFQLAGIAAGIGKLNPALDLLLICAVIDDIIGHGDAKTDWEAVAAMAKRAGISQSDLDARAKAIARRLENSTLDVLIERTLAEF